jgi:hypothetical protein
MRTVFCSLHCYDKHSSKAKAIWKPEHPWSDPKCVEHLNQILGAFYKLAY